MAGKHGNAVLVGEHRSWQEVFAGLEFLEELFDELLFLSVLAVVDVDLLLLAILFDFFVLPVRDDNRVDIENVKPALVDGFLEQDLPDASLVGDGQLLKPAVDFVLFFCGEQFIRALKLRLLALSEVEGALVTLYNLLVPRQLVDLLVQLGYLTLDLVLLFVLEVLLVHREEFMHILADLL